MGDGFIVFVVLLGGALGVAMIVGFFQAIGLLRSIDGKLDRLSPANSSSSRTDQLAKLPGPGTTKPGWYPDPEDPSLERRWAGTAWAFDPPRPRR